MNKNRLTILASALMMTGATMAQDSYSAVNLATKDLNGTARYVGMGGALGALGGDITVMGTNPAGTAMFRKTDATITMSGVFGPKGVLGHDGSRMSLDNSGIVVSLPIEDGGNLQYVNFGVNYAKSHNYLGNLNTPVENLNNTFSQTFQIAGLANTAYDNNYFGMLADMSSPIYENGVRTKDGIVGETEDADGNFLGYAGLPAAAANYQRSTYGSTSQVDMNVSFNVLDKYFFGASVGVYDVNYNRESFYQELGTDGISYDFSNWYNTDGNGVDVKLGFICRPIDDSPFRFGLNVSTPVWYRLEDINGSTLYINDRFTDNQSTQPYEYNYRTPWKFGASLGYTVGNYFAVGAEYEYQDLSTSKYNENGHETSYFIVQNDFIKKNLQPQSTLKLGMEVKPSSAFSIRCGYNYVSAPLKKDAYRIIAYDSPFTETDFTNWKATNRFTVGLGYRYKGGYVDVAYQYSAQKGDFYAFDEIDLKPTEIENNRSQLMCTFGFRF
ncbi:MAG: hypothetical protein IJ557_01130 [Bacteroidaceae bacterium]|nr:hypothetical protein [Bacteroidaceae bacterium]